MKSRMDKYYQSNTTQSRTSKNRRFYEDEYNGDYDLKGYSNVEGVADIDKNNEINLKKLQILLKKREEERENELPHLVKRNIEVRELQNYDDDKNHDINEILTQAKTEKKQDNRTRNLNNTSYDILKKINIKEVQDEDQELKDLINTVTTTSMLNKLADKDLSLDMLDELKSNNNTSIISPIEMKEAIQTQNSSYESKQNNENVGDIDKSFYTSSLDFTSDDFEQLRDIQASIKTNNKLIKFLVLVLVLAILAGIIFLIYNIKGQV